MPMAEEIVRRSLSAGAKGDRHPLNGVIFGHGAQKSQVNVPLLTPFLWGSGRMLR
jgi:hypothetical protein